MVKVKRGKKTSKPGSAKKKAVIFKSTLMSLPKKFLREEIHKLSNRPTRSFAWDARQKKALVDLVNSQPCMYCDTSVKPCSYKPHLSSRCEVEDVEDAYNRHMETEAQTKAREQSAKDEKDRIKQKKLLDVANAAVALAKLKYDGIMKVRKMKVQT